MTRTVIPDLSIAPDQKAVNLEQVFTKMAVLASLNTAASFPHKVVK